MEPRDLASKMVIMVCKYPEAESESSTIIIIDIENIRGRNIKLGNNGSSGSKLNFVCFRCDRIIEPDERMHTVSASIETPTEDGSVHVLACDAVSQLCGGCASVLLSEAVIAEKLVMPQPANEANQIKQSKQWDESGFSATDGRMKLDILVSSISDNGKGEGALEVHCSQKGFCLTLKCPDGISKATSQMFTWKQIAQLLIAADPGIFGRLDEPLHQIFPQTLTKLGYGVPNWKDAISSKI